MLNYLMLVLNIANLFYYYCLNIKKNKNLNLLQHIGNVEAGIH